jgi:hypothetical protein
VSQALAVKAEAEMPQALAVQKKKRKEAPHTLTVKEEVPKALAAKGEEEPPVGRRAGGCGPGGRGGGQRHRAEAAATGRLGGDGVSRGRDHLGARRDRRLGPQAGGRRHEREHAEE